MVLKGAKGRTLYRIMSFCCAVSFCNYGYDAGILGGVQTTKPFLDAMGNPTGTYVIPMIASSYTLAAAVMCIVVTAIGMPLGRRNCILLGDIFVIIGGSLQASSWSVAQIIVARVLCGFGIGLISCTIPTYMSEMSIESKERGPEVAVQCIWLISGVALGYWMDFGFTRMTNQVSWRFPIGFQCVFAVISFSGLIFLPDTPRWYYAKGRYADGDSVLQRLHDKPLEHPDVQNQKDEILASIEFEESAKAKFNVLDLVWDRSDIRAGRRIRVAYLVLAIQQLMGINLSVYYSTVVFSQVGLSPFLSSLLAAVMNTAFAAGTFFLPAGPFGIERVGRRNVMMYSAAVLTVCLLIFTTMINLENKTTATQWTGVAFINIYNFVFGWGWIGVPWLYGPEIAPIKHRHLGGAAGAFGEWSMSFVTVFAGGIALNNVGPLIWIWMLLSCALAVPFVYFMCPETTGKTLEEIDMIFAKKEVLDSAAARRTMHHPRMNDGEKKEIGLDSNGSGIGKAGDSVMEEESV